MSIKRLFDNQNKISKPTKNTTGDSLGAGLESSDHLNKVYKKKRRIVPSVDFTKPDEFIRFGSAEEQKQLQVRTQDIIQPQRIIFRFLADQH